MGEVAIQFGSLDELNGLIDKLRGDRGCRIKVGMTKELSLRT